MLSHLCSEKASLEVRNHCSYFRRWIIRLAYDWFSTLRHGPDQNPNVEISCCYVFTGSNEQGICRNSRYGKPIFCHTISDSNLWQCSYSCRNKPAHCFCFSSLLFCFLQMCFVNAQLRRCSIISSRLLSTQRWLRQTVFFLQSIQNDFFIFVRNLFCILNSWMYFSFIDFFVFVFIHWLNHVPCRSRQLESTTKSFSNCTAKSLQRIGSWTVHRQKILKLLKMILYDCIVSNSLKHWNPLSHHLEEQLPLDNVQIRVYVLHFRADECCQWCLIQKRSILCIFLL